MELISCMQMDLIPSHNFQSDSKKVKLNRLFIQMVCWDKQRINKIRMFLAAHL